MTIHMHTMLNVNYLIVNYFYKYRDNLLVIRNIRSFLKLNLIRIVSKCNNQAI
jgi:hypothetical protein